MTLDTATLVAVIRRAAQAVERPLLFHEVKTPARARARLERLQRWAGPMGCAVAADYIRNRFGVGPDPEPGRGAWRCARGKVAA